MSYHANTRLHYGGVKQLEPALFSSTSTSTLNLPKMRETRSKAEATKLRMNNSAAIIPKDELHFIRSITKIETKEQKRENMALVKQYKE